MAVHPNDVDDLLQDVFLCAVTAVRAGRYTPDPARPPRTALFAWLAGIAWRQATHYRERAHRRREVAVPDPWADVVEPGIDPDDQLDAREALQTMGSIPWPQRGLVVLVADGWIVSEIAEELGMSISTGFRRVRAALRLARGVVR